MGGEVGVKDKSLDIYLLGICGTGVGSLAGLLKQLGHRVRGSDEHVYPPMSEKLEEWGIEVLDGYDPSHLEPDPDLVIVGNVIRATNAEAAAARTRGLPTWSMPEAVSRLGIGDKKSIVVAGTHGKTSVTALATHVLMEAGKDPSYLVGGALVGYPESFRAGGGELFVIEGDEYDTAYFDKGPKFLHYQPHTAIITSLEFDHADIFDSIVAVERSFAALVGKVPSGGNLIIWHGAHRARRLVERHARTSNILVYSETPQADADLFMGALRSGPEGLVCEPVLHGESLGTIQIPLWGDMNAANVLAVVGALSVNGLDAEQLRQGLATYRGVRRRLELRGEPRGIAVVDDFGHHPTAIEMTIAAARTRWPGRRLWSVFEPRSATSRRNVFQDAFAKALAHADRVVIASHERLGEIPLNERFNPEAVARNINERGVIADAVGEVDAIVELVGKTAKRGDVILVFSNGAFGGLHGKLLERLGNEA